MKRSGMFICDINNCNERFDYKYPYSYFAHIRDKHSATYRQNKEYIDAKLVVLSEEGESGEWAI